MAGIFGKRGDGGSERQVTIKQYLNKELSANIKKLQKDHISSASAIRSGETVNRICSCLEAIFLHELKDSYTSKTFWPFITKFTHRDVLDQIKELLFIRTEIGQCRAWVRLAVNDCLMDSYVSAILREPSTLKQYYKQGAFLRDPELPLITNNYLQGLAVFTFQLSCNSSVLNMWDTALLLLSGAYLTSESQSEKKPESEVKDSETGKTRTDSRSSNDQSEPPALVEKASSFHEAEMSASLLAEASESSTTISNQDYDGLKESGPVKESSQLVSDDSVQVEEFEDSIVIHLESEDMGQDETKTSETNSNPAVVVESIPEKEISPSVVESLNQDIKKLGVGGGEGEREKKGDFLEDPANPFISNVSEEEDKSVVFTATKEISRKNKKKKGNKKRDKSPMATRKNVSSEPTVDEGHVKELDASQEGKDNADVSGTSSLETAVPKMQEKMQEEDDVCKEEDIYRFDSRSSLKAPRILPTRTGEDERKKTDLTSHVESKSLETVSSTEQELEKRESGNTEASKETQVFDRGEEERTEESFVELVGNSLTGMQGWSSDFNRLPVMESSHKDLSENQDGDSVLGGGNPANDSQSVKESWSGSTPEANKQRITEEQTSYPDMIEDFEVIPITNGPLSQYADDRTQALLDMVTKIGREKGLAAQKFQCRGCSCELGITDVYQDTWEDDGVERNTPVGDCYVEGSEVLNTSCGGSPQEQNLPSSSSKGKEKQRKRPSACVFGKHKVCNYDGYYYCSECHVDELAVIPARILYNWDFRKHPVARHTKLFLNQIEDMALIDVNKCNPSLYTAVNEMDQIQVLRKQIFYLKAYLFTCKQSVAEELRSKIWPREYMLENCHTYSVRDLIQVQNGSLAPQLRKIIVFAAKHVQQCALCSQKGFICEICENPKIIYPFDTDLTVRCDKCRSVFHRACKTDIKPCPRCLRRKLRSSGGEDTVTTTEFPSPFV